MKIEVGGRIVEVHKPIGRMGAIHFGIITNAAPSRGAGSKEEMEAMKNVPLTEEETKKMTDAFVEWSQRVLPNIIVGGPAVYQELTGDQQFGIFMAMIDQTDMVKSDSGELFRIVQ